MKCSIFMHRLVSLLLLLATSATGKQLYVPRLSPTGLSMFQGTESVATQSISDDYETFFYNQTLDHFNYQPQSYTTFPQRYVVNSKYWGGANSSAPILVYFGAEAPLDNELRGVGFLSDNAIRFKALLLYIEHRYYGESIPSGSLKEALENSTSRGYFSSAQALADYAEIILHVKDQFQSQNSPVIIVGGSYGGMLASWFRLKYPHIALGALASSAPILYFDGVTPPEAYFSLVSKDFQEASETCYQTIKDSWAEIDRIASLPNGLSVLSETFRTCKHLSSSEELKNYLESVYGAAAQYNAPPKYPVNVICDGINSASKSSGVGCLAKIFYGINSAKGNLSCYVNAPIIIQSETDQSETDLGWGWQTCSEMVIPIGVGDGTMFQPNPFDLGQYTQYCLAQFGVSPRVHWATTYYGGQNIYLVLKRFATNIIFSNGLRDPYSSGGVLKNISDSLVAVTTKNGSHCLDILKSKPTDPEWLVEQRETEIKIIEDWINKYYDDLRAYKQLNDKTKEE